MAGKLLGFEVGNSSLKIAVCSGNQLVQTVEVPLPENMVRENRIVSFDAMADFLKEAVKETKSACQECAYVLPTDTCYVKRVTVPLMTESQLRVNLPFEFHDYITENMDHYIYDYAVISRTDKELDLMAAAFAKEDEQKLKQMFKRAGLKLVRIVPDALCLQNLLASSDVPDKDYVILDMGQQRSHLHFFQKGIFEITRIMEFGGMQITQIIAEEQGIDTHIAQIKLVSGDEAVLTLPRVTDLFETFSAEVRRVMNFYNYNHPDNTIDALYCCGGCARIDALCRNLEEDCGLHVLPVSDLFAVRAQDSILPLSTKTAGKEPAAAGSSADLDRSPQAFGIALQD
jgi:type IV pilus assembly protein PilM